MRGSPVASEPFRIGVLETGTLLPPLARRFPGGYPAMFERWLGGGARTFAHWAVVTGDLPDDPGLCDGWVITGSRHGVHDGLPWIPRLKDFARRAAETRPVVGICFGHQLLAEAFGGRTEKAALGWGAGLQTYDVIALPPVWMDTAPPTLALLASHQDQVTEPPPGAQVLAANAFCPVAAFTVGTRVLAIQAHPEWTMDFARALYDFRGADLGEAVHDRAVASLDQPADAAMVRRWVLRFMGVPAEPGEDG